MLQPRKKQRIVEFDSKRRPRGCCQKCGTRRNHLQKDHVIPKSRGGSDDVDNIQYLCANCHEDKTRSEKHHARENLRLRVKKIVRREVYHSDSPIFQEGVRKRLEDEG